MKNCRICGSKKTEKNTRVRAGHKCLNSECTKCCSRLALARKYKVSGEQSLNQAIIKEALLLRRLKAMRGKLGLSPTEIASAIYAKEKFR